MASSKMLLLGAHMMANLKMDNGMGKALWSIIIMEQCTLAGGAKGRGMVMD